MQFNVSEQARDQPGMGNATEKIHILFPDFYFFPGDGRGGSIPGARLFGTVRGGESALSCASRRARDHFRNKFLLNFGAQCIRTTLEISPGVFLLPGERGSGGTFSTPAKNRVSFFFSILSHECDVRNARETVSSSGRRDANSWFSVAFVGRTDLQTSSIVEIRLSLAGRTNVTNVTALRRNGD